MAIISEGRLALIDRSPVFRAVGLEYMPINGLLQSYDQIYACQPAVHAVVDFLAKNLAQLRMEVFEKDLTDDSRKPVDDHPVQLLVDFPSGRSQWGTFDTGSAALSAALAADPFMGRRLTREKFFRSLWSDFFIFDRVLLVKVRDPKTDRIRALVRIPARMYSTVTSSWIAVDGFKLIGSGNEIDIMPEDAVYITGYNPNSNTYGTPALESLRQALAEDSGMDEYRRNFWTNAARYANVIQRPLDAPKWKPAERDRFMESWKSRGSGTSMGTTGMLEEGMTLKELNVSAGDITSYVSSRKLTNEEVARAFGVPRALVDMLDTGQGPFAAGVDAYRQFLYSDVLAPLLPIVSEQFELDVLAEWEADAGINTYIEYNLEEKLRGDFETQYKAGQASVGRPWMTVNEWRILHNMPPIKDGDELTVPFNVGLGAQASPLDSAPPEVAPPGEPPKAKAAPSQQELAVVRARERYTSKAFDVLSKFFERQGRSVLSAKKFNAERWDKELGDTIFGLAQTFATDAATREAARSGEPYEEVETFTFINKHAREAAASINFVTEQALEISSDADARKSVFEKLQNSRGHEIAKTLATSWASFGTREPAYQNGNPGKKKWVTTSDDSRHAALDGETVEMGKTFSNGAQYPGDFQLPTSERAGCACVLVVT